MKPFQMKSRYQLVSWTTVSQHLLCSPSTKPIKPSPKATSLHCRLGWMQLKVRLSPRVLYRGMTGQIYLQSRQMTYSVIQPSIQRLKNPQSVIGWAHGGVKETVGIIGQFHHQLITRKHLSREKCLFKIFCNNPLMALMAPG